MALSDLFEKSSQTCSKLQGHEEIRLYDYYEGNQETVYTGGSDNLHAKHN